MRLLLALLAIPALAYAQPESHYNDRWCDSVEGESEVVMADGTRADCVTDLFAVETDFAHKWAESIGQALLYAELTGREPAVLLIVGDGEARFLARWHNAADGLGIRLFVVEE